MKALGWDAHRWCTGICKFSGICPASQNAPTPCGEEFANCADVMVVDKGGEGPVLGPKPTTTPPILVGPPNPPVPSSPPPTQVPSPTAGPIPTPEPTSPP